MSTEVADVQLPVSRKFDLIKDSLLQHDDLPLADVIDCDHWQAVFDQHGIDFGADDDSVYTPAITLWALISQAFFKAEMRSCKAAVSRVAALWATQGNRICSTNTGAYCRARAKISWEAVRDICSHVAASAEELFDDRDTEYDEQTHGVVAEVRAKPISGRVMLVDGFTVTAADTEANQKAYPQNSAQKPGIGFPIIRGVSLISMVTGLLVTLKLGPYAGKQSGETWLLWQMLGQLEAGDTLVADCFYCTYWLIAACKNKGVHIVMKNHDKRNDDPVGATRISQHERTTVWLKPPCPNWMSDEDYAAMPEKIEVRLVDVVIDQAGFRSKKYTIATTVLDNRVYTRSWIASVYRSRWLIELDIRSIKCSLNMDIVRAKTPAMVRTEIWSCLLAYNLIRFKMLQSASSCERMPRSLSFTATQQSLASTWLLACVTATPELIQMSLGNSASQTVGLRPDRIEPRANKRRKKRIALLTKPRHLARLQLLNSGS
ncbi:MAG: IS4 family transposase [Pseudomonadota bacterium]